MCGICGVLNNAQNKPISKDVLKRMNDTLSNRGPDSEGYYFKDNIALAHRRLSIIDLETGSQPISNEKNNIWLICNGEIYNYKELRQQLILKKHIFKTESDSEVIIHGYEEYGVDFFKKLNGMFAFALWDENNKKLVLSRDRFGIKPLYYSFQSNYFVFSSEIKAILESGLVKKHIEKASIAQYMLCLSPLAGNTMFENIKSLLPGTILEFYDGNFKISRYWNICETVYDGIAESECAEKIGALLERAVKRNLMSDVSYASLLSGGLDSSLVSAMANSNINGRLRTYAMEYRNNSKLAKLNSDEKNAKIMSEHINSEHLNYIFDTDDYNDAFEKVTRAVEKPIDLTSVSLYLLYSKIAGDSKVVLTGEGADELFGGYYFFDKEPFDVGFPWIPYYDIVKSIFSDNIESSYDESIMSYKKDFYSRLSDLDINNKLLCLYVDSYLVDMLERQDKTSMAFGIEARVPYLDNDLVDAVIKMPFLLKSGENHDKHLLKLIANKWLPDCIINRKKKPIPMPVDPATIINQKRKAHELIKSKNSYISNYFDEKKADDFFEKKGIFSNVDNLSVFRISYAMLSLEAWHKVFDIE